MINADLRYNVILSKFGTFDLVDNIDLNKIENNNLPWVLAKKEDVDKINDELKVLWVKHGITKVYCLNDEPYYLIKENKTYRALGKVQSNDDIIILIEDQNIIDYLISKGWAYIQCLDYLIKYVNVRYRNNDVCLIDRVLDVFNIKNEAEKYNIHIECNDRIIDCN